MPGPNHTNVHNAIYGEGFECCPETGRPYERGSGALSHEQQTANFLREAGREADMPKPGEGCLQTGREFECGSGAHTKTQQTARFLRELPPAEKEQRAAAMFALAEAMPAGQA